MSSRWCVSIHGDVEVDAVPALYRGATTRFCAAGERCLQANDFVVGRIELDLHHALVLGQRVTMPLTSARTT